MAFAVRTQGALTAPFFNRYLAVNSTARGTSLFNCIHTRFGFARGGTVPGSKQYGYFSGGTIEPRCKVLLECFGKRVNIKKGSIYTKETAQTAYDSMMLHLGVQGEWEKKLLQSLLKEEMFFDRFEFIKNEEPEVTLRIEVKGERSVFFGQEEQEPFVPIEKPVQLLIKETNVLGNYEYVLCHKKLKKRASIDFALVAFFNSQVFKSMEMCNTKYSDAIRKVEILNKPKFFSKQEFWNELGEHLRNLKIPHVVKDIKV